MMFEAHNPLPRDRQNKVQELCIPFKITSSATPASMQILNDEPGFMFLKTQGVDEITPALGGDTATFAAQSDATGLFSILVNVDESIDKIECARIVRRDKNEADYADIANITGISNLGKKICLNGISGLPFAIPGATVTDLTGQNLGGLTLNAGIYKFSSSAQLTGTLTLDAQGDPNAQFIFQIGSTLTTASSSDIDLINGASADNVAWAVGSSATLGTSTDFAGNIFALASVTATTSASVNGRLYALTAAVTTDTNAITASPGASGSLIDSLMGVYKSFAILASSTTTNTGGTVVTGDLGLSPGTSVTGYPPGTVSGTQHITDATAAAAELSAMAAYTSLQGRTGGSQVLNDMDACLIVKYSVK